MTRESLQGFVFPGQGTQKSIPSMADGLYSHRNPDIRQLMALTYDEAADVLGLKTAELFRNEVGELHRPGFTEPAILTLSIAALRALRYYDFKPDMVSGHSMGEISALVAAESLSFEQALRLVRGRGEFMRRAGELESGRMAAVLGLTIEEVESICKESGAEIANINTASQIVISGRDESITYATSIIRGQGSKVMELEISIAAHSSLMEPARKEMAILLQYELIADPKIPFIQNVTADYATTAEQVRRGLIDQVSGRVLWLDTIRRMSDDGVGEYMEVGPGKVLSGLIGRIDPSASIRHAEEILAVMK